MSRPVVIAHRGASGYLPEHTLEAKALAYAMGADYLEQDIVASRDDELIVLHDVDLDTVTDVAARFPERAREDGKYYVRDFDLAELKTLNVHERRKEDGVTPVFPGRFPTEIGNFSINTLAEEIEMTRGLNAATGRNVGIYPEIKRPAWHQSEGVDTSSLVLDLLNEYGYRNRADAVFVQCFDARETRRMRELLGTDLKLVQLIAENDWGESETDYDALKTPNGLAEVAEYADGVGPWIGHLVKAAEIDGQAVSTGLVREAQAAGLVVHPYTFRADQMAPGFHSFEAMVCWFAEELCIDGLFTDFPDRALASLRE